jgi:Ca2+-binding RTX toxin-like protein
MAQLLIGTVSGDGATYEVWAEENGGATTFTIKLTAGTGDLLGFFLDYADSSASSNPSLGANTNVTANFFGDGGQTVSDDISKVGSSANNMKGTGHVFDAGMQFGEQGHNDIDDAAGITFTIDGLTFDDIDGMTFGIRAQSTSGLAEGVKLIGTFEIPSDVIPPSNDYADSQSSIDLNLLSGSLQMEDDNNPARGDVANTPAYIDDYFAGGSEQPFDATLFGYFTGSSFSDRMIGDGLGNVFSGNDGNDYLYGNGGNDELYGDAGLDSLDGGAGNDSLAGGEGNDRLFGGEGNDSLDGGAGIDLLAGGAGDDTLRGGLDNDTLKGEAGDDFIYGGDGRDNLIGGEGNDTLNGEENNDTIWGEAGNDVLNGGIGGDILIGGAGADVLFAGIDTNEDQLWFSKDDLGAVDQVHEFNAAHDFFRIDLASGTGTATWVNSVGDQWDVTVTGDFDGTAGDETLVISVISPIGQLSDADFLFV